MLLYCEKCDRVVSSEREHDTADGRCGYCGGDLREAVFCEECNEVVRTEGEVLCDECWKEKDMNRSKEYLLHLKESETDLKKAFEVPDASAETVLKKINYFGEDIARLADDMRTHAFQ